MKNIWIVANWKANKTIKEALDWLEIVGPNLKGQDNVKVVVCPNFLALSEVKQQVLVNSYPMLVGCQSLSRFSKGAYTGEVPAEYLKELAELAIIGHSERRQNFGDSDEVVVLQAEQAKSQSLKVLFCIQDFATPIPDGIKLVAFEPIFAIGTGNPDTPQSASEVAKAVKQKLGTQTEVLYGGSVNSQNVLSFLKQELLSGVLVGKASLDPQEFLSIASQAFRL